MKPLNLKEFAEDMRRKGDIRNTDLADEILALIDIEEAVAEPYSTLCFDIEHYAKDFSNPDDAAKALEWIGDRSNLLKEIEEELDKDGRTGDTDDQIKALLETFAKIRDIIGVPDTATDEDIENAIQALVDAAPAKELTYDL
ncbi:MAG: hypothetical protein ACJ8HI_07175 [Massilia sp.]|jgi:lipoate-protein ligase A